MRKEADFVTATFKAAPSCASEAAPDMPEPDVGPEVEVAANVEVAAKITPWHVFLQTAKNPHIKERLTGEILEILRDKGMEKHCVLALLEPEDSIDSMDLDQIFTGLTQLNHDRSKDVMLLLLSRGGSIEVAYQISKLCKSFASKRFVAVVTPCEIGSYPDRPRRRRNPHGAVGPARSD